MNNFEILDKLYSANTNLRLILPKMNTDNEVFIVVPRTAVSIQEMGSRGPAFQYVVSGISMGYPSDMPLTFYWSDQGKTWDFENVESISSM